MSDEKVPAAPAPAAMPAIGGGQNALLEFSDDEKTALEGMSGMDKAVLLMLSLSEEDAAQIFKNLEPKQVQKLGIRMSEMATFSQDQVNAVHKAFLKEVTKHSNLGLGNSDFVRHALVSALGSWNRFPWSGFSEVDGCKTGGNHYSERASSDSDYCAFLP